MQIPQVYAAFKTTTQNPVLTLPREDKLVDENVEGVPFLVLVYSRAHILVMSANPLTHLRKFVTPAVSHVEVADAGTIAIATKGTSGFIIAGNTATVFFALDICPHDIILGRKCLSDYSALIDFSTGLLCL